MFSGPVAFSSTSLPDCETQQEIVEYFVAKQSVRRNVSDADLAALGRLAAGNRLVEVDTLDLSDTDITDAGLEYIRDLPSVRFLFLRRTTVTDAGVMCILRLQTIEWLDLSETAVTDAGVRWLSALPALTVLYLEGTRVTTEAVWDLIGALWPAQDLDVVH
jgi:hypothetical protein